MNVDLQDIHDVRASAAQRMLALADSLRRFAVYGWRIATQSRRPERVKRRQLRQLQRTVQYAWDNVPFYRRHWTEHGFEPSMLKSLDDMRLIPVVTKDHVRAHAAEMVAANYPAHRISTIVTGGTTGMPTAFYIDNYTARAKEMAHQLWASWRFWGYRQGIDRCVTIRGARIPREKTEKGIFWQPTNIDRGLTFSSFHLLEENYDVYINKIRAERPRFIRAYPGSIVALCTLMERHDAEPIQGLKGVICSSESIYPWQRDLIRRVLGVEIYGNYGLSEKAVAAFQRGGKYVFPPTYGYTEFVDDNLKPVSEPGATAQIIATGFDGNCMPFIRLQTDDYVVVDTPWRGYAQTASSIIGRKQDFVIDRNGDRVGFTCSDEIFWELHAVQAYQYVQREAGKLEIRVQLSAPDTAVLETIRQRAAEMFINFDISVTAAERIERTGAGKFRYLIQELTL